MYRIHGAALQAFDVTTVTCVPSFTAHRTQPDTFKSRHNRFSMVPGSTADDRLIVHPDGLTKIRLRRIPRLPTACDPPTPNTPPANFEVFTRTFAEHYISFPLRHVDWDHLVAEARPKVTPQTSPATLFDILESLLKPLGDLHTAIERPPSSGNLWASSAPEPTV